MRVLPVLALIASVVFVPVSSAGTQPKTKPHEPLYQITFSVADPNIVHYKVESTVNQGDGCQTTTIQNDNFHADTAYLLKVPRTGPGPNNVNETGLSSTDGDSHDWTLDGFSMGCPANGGYRCHGSLSPSPSRLPQMLSTPGTTDKSLHLKIELAQKMDFEEAAGNAEPFGCAQQFNGTLAFEPASDDGYMPDMLSARVNVSLARMRALKPGGRFKMDVQLDPADAPPKDCGGGDTTCTESLSWNGEIIVQRGGG